MNPNDIHYDLMAGTRRQFNDSFDDGDEEFCEECGFPVDQCECNFDEDEEGPEAA